MGHIDKKIDQIFQILLNRTDSVTMQNAPEVCTDSQISVKNMNAVAVHDSNRENPAVLTGHDTHEGTSDAPQVQSRHDQDDVMSILINRQERRTLCDSPKQRKSSI